MKKLFFILSIFAVMSVAHAEDFPTQCQSGYITVLERQIVLFDSFSCPSGYVAVEEDFVTIADSACPSGYTSAGVADSCLVASPVGACIMYAPANVGYSDRTGAYMFEYACPLSDDVSGGLPVIGGGQIVRPLQ